MPWLNMSELNNFYHFFTFVTLPLYVDVKCQYYKVIFRVIGTTSSKTRSLGFQFLEIDSKKNSLKGLSKIQNTRADLCSNQIQDEKEYKLQKLQIYSILV